MLKNYVKIFYRNAKRNRTFTFINVSGLAIGMASFILILLYISNEVSYDKHIKGIDNLYRVNVEFMQSNENSLYAKTQTMLTQVLINDFPEVADATRITDRVDRTVKYSEKLFEETKIHRADPNFFEVFRLPFLAGDPKTALNDPNSVVITENIAKKYFGSEEALGKTITMNGVEWDISGIIKEIPPNTHFNFDFLCSLVSHTYSTNPNWFGVRVYTYVVLADGMEPSALEAKFPDMVDRYHGPLLPDYEEYKKSGNGQRYFMQAVKDIHLRSNLEYEIGKTGNINYLYMLFAIAAFILLTACINFLNLATARSSGRAREIGVRKVLGSQRKQLIKQFLTESVSLSFCSLVLAVGLIEFFLPQLNGIIDRELSLQYLDNIIVVPGLIGFALLVGIAAGSYPALFLSGFKPIAMLKATSQMTARNSHLRNHLVIVQFSISIILLISTGMIYNQMNYMLNKDLGFTKDQVIIINKVNDLGDEGIQTFKETLLTNANIIKAASSWAVPGEMYGESTIINPASGEDYVISIFGGDEDFVKTYGLEIVWGRGYSKEIASDVNGVIINEEAVRLMGWKNMEDKRITFMGESGRPVIGVIKDFHFQSLHNEIKPLLYLYSTGNFMSVRVKPDNVTNVLRFAEEKWNALNPPHTMNYTFVDEKFAESYTSEQNVRTIFQIFAVIAILIGCLGLFGLAAFTAAQKTKEIGIRKVLGATPASNLILLSKGFVITIGISFALAAPISYYGITQWLQGYAYQVSMSASVFIMAGVLPLGIALLTVSFQIIKAVMSNPIDSLKYE